MNGRRNYYPSLSSILDAAEAHWGGELDKLVGVKSPAKTRLQREWNAVRRLKARLGEKDEAPFMVGKFWREL